jgi:CTP:phosphocholine cytidylyltransferase-like protein
MTTKNRSRFTATHITVSRKDYDEILNKNQEFLQHLFATYRRSWSLAGVSFYDLDSQDFVKLFKLLA